MRYIGSGAVGTREGSLNWIARYLSYWEQDGFGMFAVERAEDGHVLGRAGLLPRSRNDWSAGSRAEIGAEAEIEIAWFLARRHWGAGYATEAAIAVRDWAFDEIDLRRLISLIAPENHRSIRVAEKIGAAHQEDVLTGGQVARLYVAAAT